MWSLAIETSGRGGAIAVGRGEELIEARELPAVRRHNLELAPTIQTLLRDRRLEPGSLDELYVSLGPGSFTGLRIGVTTVKMLALTTGFRVVGVPTIESVCHNVPDDLSRVAVALNHKRETVYAGLFRRRGRVWAAEQTPELRPYEQVRGWGVPVIASDEALSTLPIKLAEARVEATWTLGRQRASEKAYDDPATLTPLYVREPEAVTLWDQRHPRP